MNAERPPDVPALNGYTSHRDALASFEAAAWRQVARGDWARVLASPDRRRVARVVPFDPGWRLHLRACLDHPTNPYLPRIHWHTDLASGGLVAVMDRLEEAPEGEAIELCGALGDTEFLGRTTTDTERVAFARRLAADETLPELRAILDGILTEGRRTLPFFGGLDVRPGNVMRDRAGQLQLIDPCFVDGRKLIAGIFEDAEAVASTYPPAHLRAFLEIPVFDWDKPEQIAIELRATIEALCRRHGV